MNEIKKLDKKQMTQNVCSLLVKSGEPFESIALYLGISDRLIYYWQEGKRSPNLEHIYGISQLLEVSVESILN
jgi:transcriptional regulator with XRE-family HTH domain